MNIFKIKTSLGGPAAFIFIFIKFLAITPLIIKFIYSLLPI